jgi:TorA maturation chaperone TorD
MPATEIDSPVECALARGALYGVIASALREPGSASFRTFETKEQHDALIEAINCMTGDSAERLHAAAEGIRTAAGSTSLGAKKAAFVRVFGHTARGEVPPYETEYGTGGPFFQPQELSDIVGFYRAFGLDVDPSEHERLDHICCESEFMCFLCAKEAHALEAEDAAMAEEAARVQRLFMRDHFGAFARTVCANLANLSHAPWHAAIGEFGSALIESECKRLDVPLERAYLSLRSVEDVEVPMACGSCDGPCEPTASPEV